MAEGIVEVTAGSGTKLHSWSKTVGANTVHDEFTLPGEYPLASYFVPASSISVATVNDHILQLMAGSSLNLRIRRIRLSQHTATNTAAIGAIIVLRLTTAGTGGSAVTAAKFDNSDNAAGATAMTLPSAKGTEGTILFQESVNWRQTAPAGGGPNTLFEWVQHPGEKPIIVPAGTSNGLAVKVGNGMTAATANVIIEFVETSF